MLIALTLPSCARAAPPKVLEFVAVADGIAHTTFEVASEPAFSGHAFDVDLAKVQLSLLPAADPTGRQLVPAIAAAAVGEEQELLAVNASFFDPAGKVMGRAQDKTRVFEAPRRAGWGALVIDARGQSRIVLGDALPKEPVDGQLVVQGLPRLVVGGTVMKVKAQTAPRTAVCAAGSRLMIVVATEVETGAFASFLARPRDKGGLGCNDALNLDGGPSTQLVARLGAQRVEVPGGWGVPNALVVRPKPTAAATAP